MTRPEYGAVFYQVILKPFLLEIGFEAPVFELMLFGNGVKK